MLNWLLLLRQPVPIVHFPLPFTSGFAVTKTSCLQRSQNLLKIVLSRRDFNICFCCSPFKSVLLLLLSFCVKHGSLWDCPPRFTPCSKDVQRLRKDKQDAYTCIFNYICMCVCRYYRKLPEGLALREHHCSGISQGLTLKTRHWHPSGQSGQMYSCWICFYTFQPLTAFRKS